MILGKILWEITCIEIIDWINKHYPASVNWTGGLYCGVKLEHNYNQQHITLSTIGYVDSTQHEYKHKIPTHPQNVPHKWEWYDYGVKTQWTTNKSERFIFNAWVLDPTMMVALGTLLETQ